VSQPAATLHLCSETGPILKSADDWSIFLEEASNEVETLVVPMSRFSDEFFTLSTGLLGAVTQKYVAYRIKLVVLGDVSKWTERSSAFRDYVSEINKGRAVRFVADASELDPSFLGAVN
jgi:Domain of unknown function (DUF4180)